VEKLVHKADATLHAAAGKIIHAEATAEDMYAAIDLLADKLDGQIRKHKEKLTDHHKAEALRVAERMV
jgi:putative sigma-54 modulation protein